MFDRGLTFLYFGWMIREGGSNRISSSISGFQGQARRLVLQAPRPGLVFSRREMT